MRDISELEPLLDRAEILLDEIDRLHVEEKNPVLSTEELQDVSSRLFDARAEAQQIGEEVTEAIFTDVFDCIFEDDAARQSFADSCRNDDGTVDFEKVKAIFEKVSAEKDPVTIEDQPAQEFADVSSDERRANLLVEIRDNICGGDDAKAQRILEELDKRYDGNISKMEQSANFAAARDPDSIGVSSKEDVLWRKVDYDEAKSKYEDIRGKYNFRNVFATYDRLKFNIEAYRSGLDGAKGVPVGAGDIAMNVLELLRGNIFESLFEMGIRAFLDKVSPPRESKVDVGTTTTDSASEVTRKGDVIRENGSIDLNASREEIIEAAKGIARDNPAGGNFCGANMVEPPKSYGGVSYWETGRGEKHAAAVDGKAVEIYIPSMRLADFVGNRYLVDPFGRATLVELNNPATKLTTDETGTAYIRQLDRFLDAKDGSTNSRLEALAVGNGKSVEAFRADLTGRLTSDYIKSAAERIEGHKSFLEAKAADRQEAVQGYKEQIERLDKAIEKLQENLESIDSAEPEAGSKELQDKIEQLKSAKDELSNAISSAEGQIGKYRETTEKYEKALSDISSDKPISEKLESVISAEKESTGRADTSRPDMLPASEKDLIEALNDADSILNENGVAAEDIDAAQEEIDAQPAEIEPVEKEDGKDSRPDAEPSADSYNGNADMTEGEEAQALTVEDVFDAHAEKVISIDAEISDIKGSQLPELEGRIAAAQEELTENRAVLESYLADGVDMGAGVEEALRENILSSEEKLSVLAAEKEELSARIETLEAQSADANKVVEFIEKAHMSGAKVSFDKDGNLVREVFAEDGKTPVSREVFQMETGETRHDDVAKEDEKDPDLPNDLSDDDDNIDRDGNGGGDPEGPRDFDLPGSWNVEVPEDDTQIAADGFPEHAEDIDAETETAQNDAILPTTEDLDEDLLGAIDSNRSHDAIQEQQSSEHGENERPAEERYDAVDTDSVIDAALDGSQDASAKDEIKDAMNAYFDQSPDDPFGFLTDFLYQREEVPMEDLLNAFNEVLEGRADGLEELVGREFFSPADLLSSIIDYAHDTQMEAIPDMLDDILAGQWECITEEMLESALRESKFSDVLDSVSMLDLLVAEGLNDTPAASLSSDDYLRYERYTNYACALTYHDFVNFSKDDFAPLVGIDADTGIESDIMPDLDAIDFDSGAWDNLETLLEAVTSEVAAEEAATLIV